jgi:hypothetical protein
MKFLWEDSSTGKASTSKLWTHIAYGTATYIMIQTAHDPKWEMMLVYMAVVGGSEIAKKILTLKMGGAQGEHKDGNRRSRVKGDA